MSLKISQPSFFATDKCTYIDPHSIRDVCGLSREVLVYGYSSCFYQELGEPDGPLTGGGSPIRHVLSCTVGSPSPEGNITLEGRVMPKLPHLPPEPFRKILGRFCKRGLVMTAIENYQRAKEGKPLIPILFCISIDNNPFLSPSDFPIISVFNRFADGHLITTDQEIRLYSKLCEDALLDMPCESREVFRRISRAAIRCVHLQQIGKDSYALKRVRPPWDSPEWKAYWRLRERGSRSVAKEEAFNWKKCAALQVKAIDAHFARKYPCLSRYRSHPIR